MIPEWKMYPRSQGHSTVYLQNVVHSDFIEIGDYTTYDDFEKDPRDFQRNNVLYHYPECNHDKLKIGKFCSIACGAKFIFNAANHTLNLSVPDILRGMGTADGCRLNSAGVG